MNDFVQYYFLHLVTLVTVDISSFEGAFGIWTRTMKYFSCGQLSQESSGRHDLLLVLNTRIVRQSPLRFGPRLRGQPVGRLDSLLCLAAIENWFSL